MSTVPIDREREAAVALAEALGNLPLALEQAAAYTEQTGLSLADYLELFNERAAAYVPPASPSADYPDALAVTFEIALARIREVSPVSVGLLLFCSFLAPDDLPLEIFEVKTDDGDDLMPGARALAATLQTYALAKVRGGSFLSTHRLTQAVVRDRLSDDERKGWAANALTLMQAAFPYKENDTQTWPPSARLLQHALTATEHARALGVAGEAAMLLLRSVGDYLINAAETAEARAAYMKSVELCEKLLGPAHPQLAVGLNNIGQTFVMQGDLDEGVGYLTRALDIDSAALGPDHPAVGVRLNNVAEVQRERGDYADALRHSERALAIFEAAGPPLRAYVALTLNNIGVILRQNDPKGARAYFERALLIDEEVSGPDHPTVAIRLNNLGGALLKLGEVDAARQHFERALRIFREHLGERHPYTLTVRRNLEDLDRRAAGGS